MCIFIFYITIINCSLGLSPSYFMLSNGTNEIRRQKRWIRKMTNSLSFIWEEEKKKQNMFVIFALLWIRKVWLLGYIHTHNGRKKMNKKETEAKNVNQNLKWNEMKWTSEWIERTQKGEWAIASNQFERERERKRKSKCTVRITVVFSWMEQCNAIERDCGCHCICRHCQFILSYIYD